MNAHARMSPGPQHLQALQRANAVRLARAELKRRVALGEISAADVILETPWEAESMTVGDLITSQHRWGHTRCRRLLHRLQISENRPVGKLTDRQRRALAGLLGKAAAVREQGAEREARPALALAG